MRKIRVRKNLCDKQIMLQGGETIPPPCNMIVMFSFDAIGVSKRALTFKELDHEQKKDNE
jgi:hypothetical protein